MDIQHIRKIWRDNEHGVNDDSHSGGSHKTHNIITTVVGPVNMLTSQQYTHRTYQQISKNEIHLDIRLYNRIKKNTDIRCINVKTIRLIKKLELNSKIYW